MRFDERWIGADQLERLAQLARRTNGLPGEVVEIGTWQGLSAIPIAQAVSPSSLHVVDHWRGDNEGVQGIDPELVKRDNFGIFQANVREAHLRNVLVWHMEWREWAAKWTRPVRFAHIDATHTADEVSDQIAFLKPLTCSGGILAGDDYDWPPVAEGVHRHFQPESPNGKLWWVVL